MAINQMLWVGCGVIWGILIIAFIGITVFNRNRNRKHMRDNEQ